MPSHAPGPPPPGSGKSTSSSSSGLASPRGTALCPPLPQALAFPSRPSPPAPGEKVYLDCSGSLGGLLCLNTHEPGPCVTCFQEPSPQVAAMGQAVGSKCSRSLLWPIRLLAAALAFPAPRPTSGQLGPRWPARTYPAHRPPSHPAERPEGAEGQEVVEHGQGPGAQLQGGSGHAAQLAQPPPQGQLGEVQPAGHTSVNSPGQRPQAAG